MDMPILELAVTQVVGCLIPPSKAPSWRGTLASGTDGNAAAGADGNARAARCLTAAAGEVR